MLPSQLMAEQFKDYPAEARRLATGHLRLLQQLPLAFVPLLLEQIQEYDWRFPAECQEIERQLSYLGSLSEDQRRQLLAGFAVLKLSPRLEHYAWVNSPSGFSQELSAHLWATHQIGAFRQAATSFMDKFSAGVPPARLPAPRLGIAVFGKGVERNSYPLFRKLRPHGTYFTNVRPANGLRILLDAAATRAASHPVPYGHWYIDGGSAELVSGSSLLRVSYGALEPVRQALLHKVERAINSGVGGPEELRVMLHKVSPEEIGLSAAPEDKVLSHFQARILTDGSGTQVFSTSFVQWTTRELWRRAQPLTILARFAPRQRERPMNELLSAKARNPELDPTGSLIDADMGAFYMWIDQQRLSAANQASFLVWFENHSEALLISPTLPRNTESRTPVDMKWLLGQMG